MATSEGIVRIHGQMHEILKRVGNDSLTVEQVRVGLQNVLEGRLNSLHVAHLGFDRATTNRLVQGHVITLADLLTCDDVTICKLLVADDGVNDAVAASTVARFERIRARLDELGYELKGKRHDASHLYAAL